MPRNFTDDAPRDSYRSDSPSTLVTSRFYNPHELFMRHARSSGGLGVSREPLDPMPFAYPLAMPTQRPILIHPIIDAVRSQARSISDLPGGQGYSTYGHHSDSGTLHAHMVSHAHPQEAESLVMWSPEPTGVDYLRRSVRAYTSQSASGLPPPPAEHRGLLTPPEYLPQLHFRVARWRARLNRTIGLSHYSRAASMVLGLSLQVRGPYLAHLSPIPSSSAALGSMVALLPWVEMLLRGECPGMAEAQIRDRIYAAFMLLGVVQVPDHTLEILAGVLSGSVPQADDIVASILVAPGAEDLYSRLSDAVGRAMRTPATGAVLCWVTEGAYTEVLAGLTYAATPDCSRNVAYWVDGGLAAAPDGEVFDTPIRAGGSGDLASVGRIADGSDRFYFGVDHPVSDPPEADPDPTPAGDLPDGPAPSDYEAQGTRAGEDAIDAMDARSVAAGLPTVFAPASPQGWYRRVVNWLGSAPLKPPKPTHHLMRPDKARQVFAGDPIDNAWLYYDLVSLLPAYMPRWVSFLSTVGWVLRVGVLFLLLGEGMPWWAAPAALLASALHTRRLYPAVASIMYTFRHDSGSRIVRRVEGVTVPEDAEEVRTAYAAPGTQNTATGERGRFSALPKCFDGVPLRTVRPLQTNPENGDN